MLVDDFLVVEVLAQLVGGFQLFGPDCVPRGLVGGKHFDHHFPRGNQLLLIFTHNKHVLVVGVVRGKRVPVFVRPATANEDFAASHLLESFLVYAFGSDQKTHKINSVVLGQVNLGLVLDSEQLRHLSALRSADDGLLHFDLCEAHADRLVKARLKLSCAGLCGVAFKQVGCEFGWQVVFLSGGLRLHRKSFVFCVLPIMPEGGPSVGRIAASRTSVAFPLDLVSVLASGRRRPLALGQSWSVLRKQSGRRSGP